jgi:hypothetical protein
VALRAVRPISRSQCKDRYRANFGTSRGDPVGTQTAQLRRPLPRCAISASRRFATSIARDERCAMRPA